MSVTTLQTTSHKRTIATLVSATSGNISAAEYLNLIQRDGMLKTNNLSKVESVVTLRKNRKLLAENEALIQKCHRKDIDFSRLQLTFNEACIWLLPINSKKMAVQWYLPAGMQRNCLDIFKGEEASFVLRIYQNLETPSGWKKSQRTLEFEIDVTRSCCYINLENSTGLYAVELGLRCGRDSYIFITRSTEIRMPVSGAATIKTLKSSIKTSKQSWSKNHPLKHQVRQKTIAPKDESDWNNRDVEAEENTQAIYGDFLDEGPRSLKIANKIKPSNETARKNNLAGRKADNCAQNLHSDNATTGKLVNTLCSKRQKKGYSVNAFQVMNVSVTAKNSVENSTVDTRIQEKIDAVVAAEKPATISCKSLRDKISKLKDKAEIILRGKVKRHGQRVRVGGLLIEPDDDGSFCVACVIRNGKLYVPVEEVSAICEI